MFLLLYNHTLDTVNNLKLCLSSRCIVVSHCGSNLHLPNEIQPPSQWASLPSGYLLCWSVYSDLLSIFVFWLFASILSCESSFCVLDIISWSDMLCKYFDLLCLLNVFHSPSVFQCRCCKICNTQFIHDILWMVSYLRNTCLTQGHKTFVLYFL